MPTLVATRWVYDFTDGAHDMRALLGGKGANVAEMTRILGPDRPIREFGRRSRRNGSHWVPGLRRETTIGLSASPPDGGKPAAPFCGARWLSLPATTSAQQGSGHPSPSENKKTALQRGF